MAEPANPYGPNVDASFTERLMARNLSDEPLHSGGSGGMSGDVDRERLARLEGSVEGLRSNQTILMSTVGLVAAVLIGLASFTVIQLSNLNIRLNELPSRIGADVREVSNAISQAVTASKQIPPQVILLPAPDRQSAPTPPAR